MPVVDSKTFWNSHKRDSKETKAQVLRAIKMEFWNRGNLRYLCRPGGQLALYDRIHKQASMFEGTAEPVVAVCHRRFGKSHLGGILSVERCLAQPGAQVHFGTDTKEHARDFFESLLMDILKDMPSFIQYRTRKNIYFFRNTHWKGTQDWSKITLEGLDYNLGGAMRGGSCDFFFADEVREIRNLAYVMKRVVVPMFRGRPRPMCVLATTPPDSMDHDFVRVYVDRAKKSNSLVTIPASKNPDWTEADTKMMIQEYGSTEDIGWKREIECEMIPDASKMIVPEWSRERHKFFVEKSERPPHYAAYVVIDTGWKDHSAAVFSYYDFDNERIIVVDELFVNYTPTEEFAEMLIEKINTNFPKHIQRNMRILGDGNALNLADLNHALRKGGDYYVSEVEKYDKHAAINNLRSGVQAGRVLIEGNCEKTDDQMLNGGWNKNRTDFARSENMGHCDLVVCVVYLYRMLRWGENVSPTGDVGFKERICRNPVRVKEDQKHIADAEGALSSIFGKKRFFQKRKNW